MKNTIYITGPKADSQTVEMKDVPQGASSVAELALFIIKTLQREGFGGLGVEGGNITCYSKPKDVILPPGGYTVCCGEESEYYPLVMRA